MIEMEVVGVRVEMPSNQPIVLLKEKVGERYLPIWIGSPEATAIALAHQAVPSPRPLTHDLLIDLVEAMGGQFESISVDSLKDGVFRATLLFIGADTMQARPSDAIVIALKKSIPIYCNEEVLNAAAIEVPDDQEKEVDQFRQFLDEVNPEDFGSSS
jgi:uncharacterized protein